MGWATSSSAEVFAFRAGAGASSNKRITNVSYNSHFPCTVIFSRYGTQVDQFHLGEESVSPHLHSGSKRDIWKIERPS
jgi:hypothetical protein